MSGQLMGEALFMGRGSQVGRIRSQLRAVTGGWVVSPDRYRLPDQQPVDPLADPLQRAAGFSYLVLKETDPAVLREQLVHSARRLFDADLTRLLEPDDGGALQLVAADGERTLPTSADLLERELARAAMAADKSLISNHPRLSSELRPLADQAHRDGVLTHAMLIRAHAQTHGVIAVHWIGRERPDYEARRGAYTFWDNAGLALATSNVRQRLERELARLERIAHYDDLTGLPNQRLLDRELEQRLAGADLVAVLHLDFDGMREANNSPLGYEAGGDVLIRVVAQAIPEQLLEGEMVARIHRAGDEFACVLQPGSDALFRARKLEDALDRVELPETHQPYYGGVSVGYAISRADDDAQRLLARAAADMRKRKQERRRR